MLYNSLILCSGPGAARAMQLSTQFGWTSAAICAVLWALILLLRVYKSSSKAGFLISSALLALHPAWTISAYQGDCGGQRQTFSVIWTTAFVLICFFALVKEFKNVVRNRTSA